VAAETFLGKKKNLCRRVKECFPREVLPVPQKDSKRSHVSRVLNALLHGTKLGTTSALALALTDLARQGHIHPWTYAPVVLTITLLQAGNWYASKYAANGQQSAARP